MDRIEHKSRRGKFTPSAVAWLLVLAAILWFGGNYLYYQIVIKDIQVEFFGGH
jgi:hypothetical protein